MTTEGPSVISMIGGGRADDELDAVLEAVARRKRVLAARLFDDLEAGDRVQVNTAGIKPRYLNGALATVVEKRVTKVTILFDDDINDPYGKWAGKNCVIGAQHLVKIKETTNFGAAIVEVVPFDS